MRHSACRLPAPRPPPPRSCHRFHSHITSQLARMLASRSHHQELFSREHLMATVDMELDMEERTSPQTLPQSRRSTQVSRSQWLSTLSTRSADQTATLAFKVVPMANSSSSQKVQASAPVDLAATTHTAAEATTVMASPTMASVLNTPPMTDTTTRVHQRIITQAHPRTLTQIVQNPLKATGSQDIRTRA